nr:hypothetical protein [Deltaproteobacteria bacterium]
MADELKLGVQIDATAGIPLLMLDERRLRLALQPPPERRPGLREDRHCRDRLRGRHAQPGGERRRRDRPPTSRASSSLFVTKRTRGVGLGLAVVRRVAQIHGGSVSASNRAGGGALFTMLLQAPPASG